MSTDKGTAPETPTPVVFREDMPALPSINRGLDELFLADETRCVVRLMRRAECAPAQAKAIYNTAAELVRTVRRKTDGDRGLDAFLRQYDLSSQEGVLLMCLAEALLRIPDADTADKLIADKLAAGNWQEHLGDSESGLVNASTWGLMLTGRLLRPDAPVLRDPGSTLKGLVGRVGEPVVRTAMRQAMRIMGHQYVMGRTIAEALKRARGKRHANYRHSYDMLGEAALTEPDAARYLKAYADAIDVIAGARGKDDDEISAPSISVKLSALHPRYELSQRRRVLVQLSERLLKLAQRAKKAGIGLTMDAEEADRLELSLEIFERVYRDESLQGWNGLGLAVQAYQKRAPLVLEWLNVMARDCGRVLPVRLVKGAYWDTEVKRAQEQGLEGYPVFTRKVATDISYLACARELLNDSPNLYPQFATHNAQTLASIMHFAKDGQRYEFQRLHGMGEELYDDLVGPDGQGVRCRVYAPVGSHEDLLPYLVRRLLENGANTSFVNRIVDEQTPLAEIIADPVQHIGRLSQIPHPAIRLPASLFDERTNSAGINFASARQLLDLRQELQAAATREWRVAPLIAGQSHSGPAQASLNPADSRRVVGEVVEADEALTVKAIDLARSAFASWRRTSGEHRAGILDRAAELFEQHRGELLSLCIREAGKTIPDAVAELREAVDFLRYYAARTRADFGAPQTLPGPTGELNTLALMGRGPFACISPWNFPLAIFTGQVAAALAAGNTVIAKPAESTPLTAGRAVQLLLEAGIPQNVLSFLPGRGSVVGSVLSAHADVAGVAFTGSTETAWTINRQLAARQAPLGALIAETGGLNAMIVDSSALPEQVVQDAAFSAFNSAGQRCSALRVMCVQRDVAGRVIEMLEGHVQEMNIGDPGLLETDIGPLIDQRAHTMVAEHVRQMGANGKLLFQGGLPEATVHGTFMAPAAIAIDSFAALEREVFGPVLHVLTYRANELDALLGAINSSGYGLTLGLHTRIDSMTQYVAERVNAGNVYVNRDMIGAVVGVQPFGGQGLSGTGPKAGGPRYLHRYATEQTISVNTAAVGGNASLLSMSPEAAKLDS